MPNLSKNFRKSFLAYLNNPDNPDNRNNLATSAFEIYKDVAKKYSIQADKTIPVIQKIIKSAVHGIRLSSELSNTLDQFSEQASRSDIDGVRQASIVLGMAFDLTNPKKICLKEVMKNFLILQDKLEREDRVITHRNFYGSFFLSNSDVSNVRAKKSVVDDLIKFISNEIFDKSVKQDKYFSVSQGVDQKIRHIEEHIDVVMSTQYEQILSKLIQKIDPILHAQGNLGDIKGNAEQMTDSGKQSALKIHSFNDKWFFTFLAKVVKTIKEILGIKTSAEHLLENSADEAKKAGAGPRP